MIDLNDLAMFVQVVRAGSFSEAARRLLLPMLPRRLRACLDQSLCVAAACSELAAEITTLVPDAAALVSACAFIVDRHVPPARHRAAALA